MAFETYLTGSRGRPPLATAFGYVASIGLHGPPLALFVSAWLTHSLLIGYSGPTSTSVRMVPAYQIPVSMTGAPPGLGMGKNKGAGGGGSKGQRRRGLRGRAGRAGRRGIVIPRAVKPLPDSPSTDARAVLALLDTTDGLLGTDPMGGDGAGQTGIGRGDGSDAKQTGGGGASAAGGGSSTAAMLVVGTPPAAAAPAPTPARSAPSRGHTRAGPAKQDHDQPTDEVAEEDDVLATPAPHRPMNASFLSESMGAYFRTYETFPGLPDSYWWGGQLSYPLEVEVCVAADGGVSTVTFAKGANEDVDRLVGNAIRTWRYRPRMVGGSPRPFCHPIKIEYTRAMRAFAR
jgi:hypothetical protein